MYRCTSFVSARWLRYVTTAVVLLLAGIAWLPSARLPRRSAVIPAPDAPSDTGSRSVDVRAGLRSSSAGSTTGRPTPEQRRRPLLVLHWTERPAVDGVLLSLRGDSFSGCPAGSGPGSEVRSCRGTADRTLLPQADAVLFHGRLLKMTDLPKSRHPGQLFVFVTRESPQSTHLQLERLDHYFNLTMTYSRDADVVFPYGQTALGKQRGDLPFFHRRHRPVAWMVSHCRTASKREQYVSQLARHIPVDTFGSCGGGQRCPGLRTDCYRRLAETHLFYLAFENSLCDDYITEKFWLALEVGMVPVVRGPPPEAYRRVAPPNSFIHVEDFAGPRALAEYLVSLASNRTLYGGYHAWRRTHRVENPQGLCRLCQQLAAARGEVTVRLSNVWDTRTHCHEPRDIDSNG